MTTSTTKRDQEKQRIHRYFKRFQKAERAKAEKHELWNVLDTFDRGDQWKNANLPPWVPKPVTNYIRYLRTLKRANLSSAIPMSTFTAEFEEDKPTIDRLDRAYRHVWNDQKVPRILRRCVDRAVLQGTAIAYVYSEDDYVGGKYLGENDPRNKLFQGKLCVKRFSNANFFPDPDAYTLDDCKFVETTELLSLNQIKENPRFIEYTKKNGTHELLQDLKMGDLQAASTDETGEIYGRDTMPSNSNPYIEGDEMVVLHTHWSYYFKEGDWHLDVTYYLRYADFELLRIEDVEPAIYPFAVLYDEEEENEFWGSSTAMDHLENQKLINKTSQTASIIATLHQNPQKIVSRESGINAQELARTGTVPGKVWTSNSDPRNSIVNVDVPDIPKGIFDVEDRVKNDIREIAGVNEAYTGQSVGSLTTSTGVNSLIDRATIRDKDKMIQIDAFVERISHLIMLFILYKWEGKRTIVNEQPNGTATYEEFEPIDPSLRKNISWRVKCNTYARAPMTQASRKQQADQLMQYQGQFAFDPPIIIPEEWIQMQDFEDKEKILARIEEDRRKKEANEAMDWTNIVMQTADHVTALRKQGLSNQNVQTMVQQFITELLENQKAQQAGRPKDAQQAPTPGQGVTGQTAMMAQARGA